MKIRAILGASILLLVSVQTQASSVIYGMQNANNEKLYTYDIANDISALVGTTSFGPGSGLTFNVSPVPVPAAIWLFGTGIIGLVGFARRKQRSGIPEIN